MDMACVPYEGLVDTCLSYLAEPDRLVDLGERNYQSFKTAYPMVDALGVLA